MRHHLHIWLFYLNKLWNRFCLVLRGKSHSVFVCFIAMSLNASARWKVYAIGAVCVCVWSLKRRARHQISHLPLRVGIISKCVMDYIFMTWQRFKKKLKTNLFIERFTASSQPCNFLKKIFSFFLFSWQNICCGWALMRTLWSCSLHAVPLFGLPEQYQYLLILYKNAFTLASFVESHMTVWSRTDKHKRTTTTKMTVGPVKMEHNWRIRGCNNFILPR